MEDENREACNVTMSCKVHIRGPFPDRIERWTVGKEVDQATYDAFKDADGTLYALFEYKGDVPERRIVKKDIWHKTKQTERKR